MAKRRIKADGDEEDDEQQEHQERDSSQLSSSPNKRARCDNIDGNEEFESEQVVTQVDTNVEHHTTNEEEDSTKDDNNPNDPPPQSEEVAARTPLRSINAAGKPPEAGVILKVHVENFMCHRKLTINLCKNVNFIHGQNGSGKSAILGEFRVQY